ncbi:MAG: succinate dehydrogenase/fumarate reductase iron-sulfur subunit [Arcobacter sp.]|nr:succinate dehydrogenase/fumarate reductase iron-sulfur subunit [Arcobacter sp.]
MKLIINNNDHTIDDKITNLLDAFLYIKEHINKSFAFNYGCKSGVCGSCSVLVNNIEMLACTNNFKELDVILPLRNLPIVRDLVVDNSNIQDKLTKANAFLLKSNTQKVAQKDVATIDTESSCILCNSCYSSCPVYSINENFLGPFALTRVYRYVNDKKENDLTSKLDIIQKNGIWDCTLCGACNTVCPQSIDIKGDILKLQNLSVCNGYQNPAFSSFSGFDTSFDNGFNPNGF